MQCTQHQIVYLYPDRSFPVILALAKFGMRCRKTANAVRGPEMIWIAEQIKDGAEARRARRQQREHKGKE